MARHSEDECANCQRDLLPLSYITGDDAELYCSIKCAEEGERKSREKQICQVTSPASINSDLTLIEA